MAPRFWGFGIYLTEAPAKRLYFPVSPWPLCQPWSWKTWWPSMGSNRTVWVESLANTVLNTASCFLLIDWGTQPSICWWQDFDALAKTDSSFTETPPCKAAAGNLSEFWVPNMENCNSPTLILQPLNSFWNPSEAFRIWTYLAFHLIGKISPDVFYSTSWDEGQETC